MILATADVLGRAYAKGAADKLKAAEKAVEAQAKASLQRVVAVPPNLKVSVPGKPSSEERGWSVIAVRADQDDPNKLKFFVARPGGSAEWHAQADVTFT